LYKDRTQAPTPCTKEEFNLKDNTHHRLHGFKRYYTDLYELLSTKIIIDVKQRRTTLHPYEYIKETKDYRRPDAKWNVLYNQSTIDTGLHNIHPKKSMN